MGDISEVTRARHLAWLAYNLTLHDQRGQRRAAANEAAAAAASTGDLEATILANLTLAVLDGGEGYAGRSVRRLEELCALARTSDAAAAHDLAAIHYAHPAGGGRPVGRRCGPGRRRNRASPPGRQRDGP